LLLPEYRDEYDDDGSAEVMIILLHFRDYIFWSDWSIN